MHWLMARGAERADRWPCGSAGALCPVPCALCRAGGWCRLASHGPGASDSNRVHPPRMRTWAEAAPARLPPFRGAVRADGVGPDGSATRVLEAASLWRWAVCVWRPSGFVVGRMAIEEAGRGRCETLVRGGAGGWDRRGCAAEAPGSATRQGEEQHRHTERGSHTRRDKGGHSRQGGGAQQGRRGNQNSGNREPEWSGWESVRMGGSDNKGDGLASQPRRYRVPGQPLLNRHQVGGVSRSPDGLFVQQEREPIRGRPAVRGKRTYGGRPGQRVEEQGTWASRTQNHSEAGYGRPVERGTWTAETVKRPRQQPAHPQYANYWAPLTRKRHTMPHSAQPRHTNYWAPRPRKRHQQEHRPQRPTERSDPTQHAKGRTGDCPGPRKGATTRWNVTRGLQRGPPQGQSKTQGRPQDSAPPDPSGVCGREARLHDPRPTPPPPPRPPARSGLPCVQPVPPPPRPIRWAPPLLRRGTALSDRTGRSLRPCRSCTAPTPRRATSCQLRHDRMEQGPTESHAGRSTFLLSSGGGGGGYY